MRRERPFVREEHLFEEIKRNVRLVALPDVWKDRFLLKVELWENDSFQIANAQIDRLRHELTTLKSKIDRINQGFADGNLDVTEFKEMKNPLVSAKKEIEQQLTQVQMTKANRLEPLKQWILAANTANSLASAEKPEEMKSFLMRVGSNRLLQGKKLSVEFTKPWNLLAETNIAASRGEEFFPEPSRWWSRGDSNP